MRPSLFACLSAAALLSACDQAADLAQRGADFVTGGLAPANGEGAPRRQGGAALDLVRSMAERQRLPQRDYDCRLIGAGAEARPYGVLGVVTDRYTLIVKGGGREEGRMVPTPDLDIEWDGGLGPVSQPPHRISRARINTEGNRVELAFDIRPETDGGHGRLVCRAEV